LERVSEKFKYSFYFDGITLIKSKQLITMLNCWDRISLKTIVCDGSILVKYYYYMGHFSSYGEVEAVDTILAMEVVATSGRMGVIIPFNIGPKMGNRQLTLRPLPARSIWSIATTCKACKSLFKKRCLAITSVLHPFYECSAYDRPPSVNSFVNKVDLSLCRGHGFLHLDAQEKGMAWSLHRHCSTALFHVDLTLSVSAPSPVPGWSGFNAIVSSFAPALTSIGYCPMIARSSTEFSTIYTDMKSVHKMVTNPGQSYSVISFTLAIYVKAKEIQWRFPKEFKDIIIRMGGLFIASNYVIVIGKTFEESGLENLPIELGVYGCYTASVFREGKTHNRDVRA